MESLGNLDGSLMIPHMPKLRNKHQQDLVMGVESSELTLIQATPLGRSSDGFHDDRNWSKPSWDHGHTDMGFGYCANLIINESSGLNPISAAGSGSMEQPLECQQLLLSATNSNTDASIGYDGKSIMFSAGSRSCLLNFGSAVSADESPKAKIIPDSAGSKMHSRPPKLSTRRTRDQLHEHNYANLDRNQGGFRLICKDEYSSTRLPDEQPRSSSDISFKQGGLVGSSMDGEPDAETIQQMKEMIYRAAAFRPVNLGVEVMEKPKRKNVRISSDPQTVAARQRRERISERLRVLQKLVPGGSKMDTATMLDEAANYLKFLRAQVIALETLGNGGANAHNLESSTNALVPPPTNYLSFSHHSS